MTTAEFIDNVKQSKQLKRRVKHYLSHSQKLREAAHSSVTMLWSVWLLTWYSLGQTPLSWTNFGAEHNIQFAKLVLTFSLIHALGAWLNGHYRWSPLLRFIGFFGLASCFAMLTYFTPWERGSSGTIPYGFLSVYLWITCTGVWPDVQDAFRRGRYSA